MYKMFNLYQKPKSKTFENPPTKELTLNNNEVAKIMGSHYNCFVNSKEDIYETIG